MFLKKGGKLVCVTFAVKPGETLTRPMSRENPVELCGHIEKVSDCYSPTDRSKIVRD